MRRCRARKKPEEKPEANSDGLFYFRYLRIVPKVFFVLGAGSQLKSPAPSDFCQ